MTAVLAPIRLADVLHIARLRNASDVHLCADFAPVMRVDGALELQPTLMPGVEEIEAITSAMLSKTARAQMDASGDASVTYRDNEVGSIRVHAYRTSRGISLAMRLLSVSVPTLEALHLPAVVMTFADRPAGLILFTGPTGSGKSTALAAMIDYINRTQAKHIITIEDPIEYEHRSNRSIISQRHVGIDVPSFADAIYGALRCDPNVILIGEMRDPSTMHAALTAAETGHLVLATLHTGDAPQTIDRIIGAFSGETQEQIRVQLAQSLIAVVCMRLVPRACGQGRRSAIELLLSNDAVRNLIRDGKTHQLRNIISTSRQTGMQTLEAHLSDLIARREITFEAAKAAAARTAEVRSSTGTIA